MQTLNFSTRWRLAQVWFAGIAFSSACSAVLGVIPSVRMVGTLLVLSVLPAAIVLALWSGDRVTIPVVRAE
jgi:hypothetical protein